MTTTDTLATAVDKANDRAKAAAPKGGIVTAESVTANWDKLSPKERAGFRRMGMGPKPVKAAKTKPAAKATGKASTGPKVTSLGSPLTASWKSSKGVEVNKGDKVTGPDRIAGVAAYRFTKVTKEGRIPMIGVLASGDHGVTTATGKAAKHTAVPSASLTHAK
jgi:hypothetical protein